MKPHEWGTRPELQAARLWLDRRQWERFDPAKESADATLSWRREFLREFEEAAKGTSPPLGRLPVVVVASQPVLGRADCQSQSTAAACLDFLSANAVHIVAEGSGHEIHLYQPETLVKALLRVVAAVRDKVPLSTSD